MIQRRNFLAGGAAFAVALTVPLARVEAAAKDALTPVKLPPPISSAERLGRIARARTLMQRNGIGAVIVLVAIVLLLIASLVLVMIFAIEVTILMSVALVPLASPGVRRHVRALASLHNALAHAPVCLPALRCAVQ